MEHNVTEILTRHLSNVKAKIAQQMQANNRNASGCTVDSLTIDINGNVGTLYGAAQFLSIEKGRNPGKAPYGFVGIIKQWILDKGIAVKSIPSKSKNVKYTPYERGLNSMAGAIAYNIMKKGTRLYRDKCYNDIYTSAINEELALMADDMMLEVSQSILQINNSFEK